MELLMLLVCGGLAIAASCMVIFARNTVHSALWMVASFFCMAVIFLLLRAQLLAILQIIVYAGAIMMFILYAIMTLNLRQEDTDSSRIWTTKALGLVLVVMLFMALAALAVGRGILAAKGPVTVQAMEKFGYVEVFSHFLFSDYLLPFEVASVLLTAGVVGSVVLAKIK